MRLLSSAVAVAAGVVMVLPLACHGTPHSAMEFNVTPWDAVEMPWQAMVGQAMVGTMAMPRKCQMV